MAPPWLPMAGKTKGRAPEALSQSTVARTMTAMLAIPRLPAPTATVSPRLIGQGGAGQGRPDAAAGCPPGGCAGRTAAHGSILGSATDRGMAGS